jgi:hypothetical protein
VFQTRDSMAPDSLLLQVTSSGQDIATDRTIDRRRGVATQITATGYRNPEGR